MYEYRARVENVVDGDTIDVVVDVGFHIQRQIRLRLARVDTHETYGVAKDGDEYRKGKRESEFVGSWLESDADDEWPIVVRTEKKGKYGRYLAEVERRRGGEILNDALLREFDGVGNE